MSAERLSGPGHLSSWGPGQHQAPDLLLSSGSFVSGGVGAESAGGLAPGGGAATAGVWPGVFGPEVQLAAEAVVETQPEEAVYVVSDSANLFSGAQLIEGKRNMEIKVNLATILPLIDENRPIKHRVVVASFPERSNRMWRYFEQRRYHIIYKPEEAHVAAELAAQLRAIIAREPKPNSRCLLVFVTGDGNAHGGQQNFPDLLTSALQRGWSVEVVCWRSCLNPVYETLCNDFPRRMRLRFLDSHRADITFFKPRMAPVSSTASPDRHGYHGHGHGHGHQQGRGSMGSRGYHHTSRGGPAQSDMTDGAVAYFGLLGGNPSGLTGEHMHPQQLRMLAQAQANARGHYSPPIGPACSSASDPSSIQSLTTGLGGMRLGDSALPTSGGWSGASSSASTSSTSSTPSFAPHARPPALKQRQDTWPVVEPDVGVPGDGGWLRAGGAGGRGRGYPDHRCRSPADVPKSLTPPPPPVSREADGYDARWARDRAWTSFDGLGGGNGAGALPRGGSLKPPPGLPPSGAFPGARGGYVGGVQELAMGYMSQPPQGYNSTMYQARGAQGQGQGGLGALYGGFERSGWPRDGGFGEHFAAHYQPGIYQHQQQEGPRGEGQQEKRN